MKHTGGARLRSVLGAALFFAAAGAVTGQNPVITGVDDSRLPKVRLLVAPGEDGRVVSAAREGRVLLRRGGSAPVVIEKPSDTDPPLQVFLVFDNRFSITAENRNLHQTLALNLRRQLGMRDEIAILTAGGEETLRRRPAEDSPAGERLILPPTVDPDRLVAALRDYDYRGSADALAAAISRARALAERARCAHARSLRPLILVVSTHRGLPSDLGAAGNLPEFTAGHLQVPVSFVYRERRRTEPPAALAALVRRTGGYLGVVGGRSPLLEGFFDEIMAAVQDHREERRWIQFRLPDDFSGDRLAGRVEVRGLDAPFPFDVNLCPDRLSVHREGEISALRENISGGLALMRSVYEKMRRDLDGDGILAPTYASQGVAEADRLEALFERNARLRSLLGAGDDALRLEELNFRNLRAEFRLAENLASARRDATALLRQWDLFRAERANLPVERVPFYENTLAGVTFEQATRDLHAGRRDRASRLVSGALERAPEAPRLLLARGYLRFLENNPAEAEADLRAAVDRDTPGATQALTHLLLSRVLEGRADDAEVRRHRHRGLNQAAVFPPSDPIFLTHVARAHALEGDFEGALARLDQLPPSGEPMGDALGRMVAEAERATLLRGSAALWSADDRVGLRRLLPRMAASDDPGLRARALDYEGRLRLAEGDPDGGAFLIMRAVRLEPSLREGHPVLSEGGGSSAMAAPPATAPEPARPSAPETEDAPEPPSEATPPSGRGDDTSSSEAPNRSGRGRI